ncbi:MAG: AAA family ATPase, partial [Pseudomonadota bacterium]
MLDYLRVQDFAIIDSVSTPFAGGMTALTGETGAGKSILLDAIGLVLGDRAERHSVRDGAARAEIEASFSVAAESEAARWLSAHDLDDDGVCTLRRVVRRDGRSRAYVNGRSVSSQALRELGEMLVHIHGQHEHQHLSHADRQRQIVDARAGVDGELETLATLHAGWRQSLADLRDAEGQHNERSDRLDLLQFQLRELQGVQLDAEGIDTLFAEHRKLSNAEQLIASINALISDTFDDDGSAHERLSRALRVAESLADTDPELAQLTQLVGDALINLDEAASVARGYVSGLDLDPTRLAEVDEQIAVIHGLARKHRVEARALPALRAQVEA